MKRTWKRQIRILGMAALCSLALAGCSQKKETEPEGTVEGSQEPAQEENTQGERQQPEDTKEAGGQENQDNGDQNPVSRDLESLTGDIREVGDKTFTIVKAFLDETEDGGMIMATPADDDFTEETDMVTVSYNENTVFEKQTIWDGGARHEEAEGSARDLERGRSAEISGYYEGQIFHAEKIRVIEVVL